MEEKNLATEMLHELKAQSKRKDIIIVILIGVIRHFNWSNTCNDN